MLDRRMDRPSRILLAILAGEFLLGAMALRVIDQPPRHHAPAIVQTGTPESPFITVSP